MCTVLLRAIGWGLERGPIYPDTAGAESSGHLTYGIDIEIEMLESNPKSSLDINRYQIHASSLLATLSHHQRLERLALLC